MDILKETIDEILNDQPDLYQIYFPNNFESEHIEPMNVDEIYQLDVEFLEKDDYSIESIPKSNDILDESDNSSINDIHDDDTPDLHNDHNQSIESALDFIENFVDPNLTNELIDNNNIQNNVQYGGHLTYRIDRTSTRSNLQFNCEESTYQLRFSRTNSTFDQAINEIYHAFEDLCEEFVTTLNEKDKIRIAFIHTSLDPAINLPFMSREILTPDNLLALFERVAQSKKTIKLNESNNLRIDVIIARLPAGSGRKAIPKSQKKNYIPKPKRQKREDLNAFEEWCTQKACVKFV